MPTLFRNYTHFTEGQSISQKLPCKGWKQMVKFEDCAALVIFWTCTRGSMNVLQLIFGMTMTNLNEHHALDAIF